MSPAKRPILTRSGMTGRIYIVTRYSMDTKGRVVANEKFDVTDEFEAIEAARAAEPEEELFDE